MTVAIGSCDERSYCIILGNHFKHLGSAAVTRILDGSFVHNVTVRGSTHRGLGLCQNHVDAGAVYINELLSNLDVPLYDGES